MKKLLIFLAVLLIIFGIYQYRLYSYIQKPETGWEYAVEYDLKSEPSYKGTIYVYSDKLINTNSSLGANQNGAIGEYTKTVYMYNSGSTVPQADPLLQNQVPGLSVMQNRFSTPE